MSASVEFASGSLNLGDIPDLSGIEDTQTAWEDGWYEGVILERRSFTDKNGNERVFESSDAPAKGGDSRNVQIQVQIKRQDGRELNTSARVNYQPGDLTTETLQKVAAQKEKSKDEGWGPLFRPFMSLLQLGALQKIAGVRQFQRDTDGGLILTPLFGKKAYFKLEPDDKSGGKYKQVGKFRADRPSRVPVL
mgnify:FL=1